MGERAIIDLPVGTHAVPIKDVPDIFARALYPDQLDGSWRVLLNFKKRLPDNQDQSLDYNDWALLDRIFDRPPPFKQRMYDLAWQQVEAIFESSPHKPNWQLLPVWHEHEKDSRRLQLEKGIGVLADLMAGLRTSGFTAGLSGRLPPAQALVDRFKSGQFSIDELRIFADKFRLEVRVSLPQFTTIDDLATRITAGEVNIHPNGWKQSDAEQRCKIAAAFTHDEIVASIVDIAAQGKTIKPLSPVNCKPLKPPADADKDSLLTSDDVHTAVQCLRVAINWRAIRLAQEQAKLDAGRYTIEEAARELATHSGRELDRWLETMIIAVRQGHLALKNPRDYEDRFPYDVPQSIEVLYDQITDADLNIWLDTHPEWGVDYRFPTGAQAEPPASDDSSAISTSAPKERRDILDPAIDTAIDRAGSKDNAAVWVSLKDLALNSTAPFLGTARRVDGALEYTDAKNRNGFFTQKALRDRLRRRRNQTR